MVVGNIVIEHVLYQCLHFWDEGDVLLPDAISQDVESEFAGAFRRSRVRMAYFREDIPFSKFLLVIFKDVRKSLPHVRKTCCLSLVEFGQNRIAIPWFQFFKIGSEVQIEAIRIRRPQHVGEQLKHFSDLRAVFLHRLRVIKKECLEVAVSMHISRFVSG